MLVKHMNVLLAHFTSESFVGLHWIFESNKKHSAPYMHICN